LESCSWMNIARESTMKSEDFRFSHQLHLFLKTSMWTFQNISTTNEIYWLFYGLTCIEKLWKNKKNRTKSLIKWLISILLISEEVISKQLDHGQMLPKSSIMLKRSSTGSINMVRYTKIVSKWMEWKKTILIESRFMIIFLRERISRIVYPFKWNESQVNNKSFYQLSFQK